jgi:hypothetical protein
MEHRHTFHRPYVVLPVLLLAAFLLAAPAAQQPEKISNVQPDWDQPSNSFVIDFRATAGLAREAVSEGYFLMTTLTVTDRSGRLPSARLSPTAFGVELLRPDSSGEGLVRLRPQIIPWDQEDGTYVGLFDVMVSSELKAPTGETIARTTPRSKTLCLGPGQTVPQRC